MHLSWNQSVFLSQANISPIFKIFPKKFNLRVAAACRDGMRATEASWSGHKAGSNRPKSAGFWGFLPGIGPVLRGWRPTSGPTGSGPSFNRPSDGAYQTNRQAATPNRPQNDQEQELADRQLTGIAGWRGLPFLGSRRRATLGGDVGDHL